MQDGEHPNPGRRVRSADAAVFRAVEHEAAARRKSGLQQAQRSRAGIPQNGSRDLRRTPQTTQKSRQGAPDRTGQRPVQRHPKGSDKPVQKKRQRKSSKEALSYGIHRRRRMTLPLLIILLIVLLFGIAAVAAITIYNEDTDLIVSERTIEAGTTADISMYVTDEPRFPDYVSCNLDFSTVNYIIPQTIRFTVRMYGTNFPCVLNIVDSTPPTAEGIPQTLFSVDEIPPVEECIRNISDLNDVTVQWLELPDITYGGQLTAKALITDSSGNETIVDVPLNVTRDIIAPVIEGAEDIESFIGDTISYRENITVTDDIDEKPFLEIDTSEVDMNEPGVYVVTYRAKDFTGNVSEVQINLTLKKKPSTYVEPELVYEEARKVLDRITNEDMTDMEKALQITWWVRYHVYYVNNCDNSSWTRAAYDAFTKQNGNCYNYAMCAKALFDVAGIENMIIIRDPYIYNPHYWNYINIDGEWYHCDSTPRIGYNSYFFMYTTKELKNFWHNGWNGYNFPEDLYPESATESVQSKINYGGHKIRN